MAAEFFRGFSFAGKKSTFMKFRSYVHTEIGDSVYI